MYYGLIFTYMPLIYSIYEVRSLKGKTNITAGRKTPAPYLTKSRIRGMAADRKASTATPTAAVLLPFLRLYPAKLKTYTILSNIKRAAT